MSANWKTQVKAAKYDELCAEIARLTADREEMQGRALEAEFQVGLLRRAIAMAENRLEAAHAGNDDVCRSCIDVARSYLQKAVA